MTRIIRIETCGTCQHRDHKGAFAKVSYVPVCRKVNRKLPHEVVYDKAVRMTVAEGTGEIPSWCPLEKLTCAKSS